MPGKPRTVTLEKVVDVSVALADERGWDQVTLAAVAAQLDIRIPSLYNHVDGLAGLHRQMTLWGLRQLADSMRRAAVGVAGEDAIERVAAAYRGFATAHPGLYRATLRAPAPDDTEMQAAAQEILDVTFALLAHYRLDSDDLLHAVRILRSLLHGFVDLETSGGFGLALDRDETFRRLIAAFVSGIGALTGEGMTP